MSEPWLDKCKLAEHLSCSVRSIELAMNRGLPHAVVFGRAKFRASEVEAWLERTGTDLAALDQSAPQRRNRRPLWLYAIQAGGYGGDIKIGISCDPIARLATLQTAHAEPLRGLGAWPGTRQEERQLHELYAGVRVRGEWFGHCLPLWRLIRDLGGDFRWER